MSDSLRPQGLQPTRLLCPWDSPGKNTGVGCHALFQGILPTQGVNAHLFCLLHMAGRFFGKPLMHTITTKLVLTFYLQFCLVGTSKHPFLACAETFSCFFNSSHLPIKGRCIGGRCKDTWVDFFPNSLTILWPEKYLQVYGTWLPCFQLWFFPSWCFTKFYYFIHCFYYICFLHHNIHFIGEVILTFVLPDPWILSVWDVQYIPVAWMHEGKKDFLCSSMYICNEGFHAGSAVKNLPAM